MGRLHAAKLEALCRESDDLEFAGIADIIVRRAQDAAIGSPCLVTDDFRDLLPRCDALIVAVPTVSHHEVVSVALKAGLDVLVEKPIAATLEEAEELIALSKATDRVLQVGHLEWFNSSMRVIREHISRPRFVEIHRLGPFSDRSTDVDVIRDLMIHDLDILQQVVGEEPESIAAVGIPVLTPNVDIANARLTFPGGCVANLTASRVSSSPMRKQRFFQRDSYFSIDFLEQSAVAFRRDRCGESGAPKIKMEKIEVDRKDALRSQLEAFVQAVRRSEKPQVDGSCGLGALRTALKVIDSIPPFDDFE